MTKDSYGTLLPKSVFLNSDSSVEELGKALTVNTFLLAVESGTLCTRRKNCIYYRKQAYNNCTTFVINTDAQI